MKCAFPRCRKDSDLLYIGKPLCQRCYTRWCENPEELCQKLKISRRRALPHGTYQRCQTPLVVDSEQPEPVCWLCTREDGLKLRLRNREDLRERLGKDWEVRWTDSEVTLRQPGVRVLSVPYLKVDSQIHISLPIDLNKPKVKEDLFELTEQRRRELCQSWQSSETAPGES